MLTNISPRAKQRPISKQILAVAQTPLEMAIAALSPDTPDADLLRVLGPLLAEVGQLDPIVQPRLLKQIQEKCGKDRLPITALRKQMKVVRIDSKKKAGGKRPGAARSPGPATRGGRANINELA